MSKKRIAVVHPDPGMEWLGRSVVIRPAEPYGMGVSLWFEKDRPDFEEDLARLAEITGYPITHEHHTPVSGDQEGTSG